MIRILAVLLARYWGSAVATGDRVRIVEMDGCMAHIRGKVREGRVVGLAMRQVYGDTQKRLWAVVKDIETGRWSEWPAQQHHWTRGDDGVMEHRI